MIETGPKSNLQLDPLLGVHLPEDYIYIEYIYIHTHTSCHIIMLTSPTQPMHVECTNCQIKILI